MQMVVYTKNVNLLQIDVRLPWNDTISSPEETLQIHIGIKERAVGTYDLSGRNDSIFKDIIKGRCFNSSGIAVWWTVFL